MEGPIEEVNSIHDMLHYSIDTTGGQSGSAVYYERNGEFNIVGLHVLGIIDRVPSYLCESS
jgi:V8-like Glu-specific endopeptidase